MYPLEDSGPWKVVSSISTQTRKRSQDKGDSLGQYEIYGMGIQSLEVGAESLTIVVHPDDSRCAHNRA